jgi:hypothetical protein
MDQDMEWIVAQVNARLRRPETIHEAIKLLAESVDTVLAVPTSAEAQYAALAEIRLVLAQIRRWERDLRHSNPIGKD